MKDLYTDVTNRIIAALEQGTPPWVCPWQNGNALPSNLATGKPYRGINILMLSIATMNLNYPDSRWLTFKQASETGARIRKGEHGTPITFYRLREINDATSDSTVEDKADKRAIPMLKTYSISKS